jgi:hypothetical protein
MRPLRVGALIVACVVSLLGGTASAEDGAAALLPFQGSQAVKVRQNVQKGLRTQGVKLVPLKQVSNVVKKTKGYAKQASRLNASVLVKTRVRRVEGRFIADTEVRNAKGARVKKLRVGSSSVSRLSNRIVAGLMKTGLMPTAVAAAPATPEPEPPAPDKPRAVVRPFSGTQAAKVRGAAVRGLSKEPIELYPNANFTDKAKSLGANLQADGGHVAPASALAVSGLFEGDVVREDGVWSAYIRLVDGRSAKVVSQHYYEASSLSGLMKRVQNNVGNDFRKDIKKLGVVAPAAVAVAPAPAKQPVKTEPVVVKTKQKQTKPKDKGPAAVDIEVDFRIVRRTLKYNDVLPNDPRGNIRDYTLGAGPGVAIKFQYFPGAHFTDGVGAQFGIDFEWDRLFDFDSKNEDGESFPTESQQFLIGLRWRYPTGRWEPFVVVDYGVHNFRFGVSGPPPAPPLPPDDNTAGVPSVTYEFVRIGGGFRVVLGKKDMFVLGSNIALRAVFDVGGIGSSAWFPNAKANGMDVGFLFGIALPKGFEIRLSGDYRRYWFDLNPSLDAPYVAGGALDQYLGGSLGLAWRW